MCSLEIIFIIYLCEAEITQFMWLGGLEHEPLCFHWAEDSHKYWFHRWTACSGYVPVIICCLCALTVFHPEIDILYWLL